MRKEWKTRSNKNVSWWVVAAINLPHSAPMKLVYLWKYEKAEFFFYRLFLESLQRAKGERGREAKGLDAISNSIELNVVKNYNIDHCAVPFGSTISILIPGKLPSTNKTLNAYNDQNNNGAHKLLQPEHQLKENAAQSGRIISREAILVNTII